MTLCQFLVLLWNANVAYAAGPCTGPSCRPNVVFVSYYSFASSFLFHFLHPSPFVGGDIKPVLATVLLWMHIWMDGRRQGDVSSCTCSEKQLRLQ